MQERMIVGIDVGTTKICVLAGELNSSGKLSILGVGVSPSRGLRRGVVVNIDETVSSIATALDRAERLTGQKIAAAYIGVAGSHIESVNSKGIVAISPSSRDIVQADINRAIEAARAIPVPTSREIVHVIPRGFVVDGQEGVKNPTGMSGFRLEVEAHIVTGAVTSIHNLIKCVQKSQVEIDDLVLEPLASAEAVLSSTERDLGVVLVDIGGGTTDIALFSDGAIWHTSVLPFGGNLITNDIAYGLRLPFAVAEEMKVTYGHADPAQISENETIDLSQFIPDCNDVVQRRVLAEIIEARVDEIVSMVKEEIQKSGYTGLLSAGIVLTGGTSDLPGLAEKASKLLDLPVRQGVPSDMLGLSESICKPPFATAAGLLLWGAKHGAAAAESEKVEVSSSAVYRRFVHWLQAFLP